MLDMDMLDMDMLDMNIHVGHGHGGHGHGGHGHGGHILPAQFGLVLIIMRNYFMMGWTFTATHTAHCIHCIAPERTF